MEKDPRERNLKVKECSRTIFKGNECVYGGKERLRKQYSYADIDVWIRDLDMDRAQQSKTRGVEIRYLRVAC